MHTAIGKRFVKFDHERLVLRPDRTNGHFNAANFSRDHVIGRVWPDWRSREFGFAYLRIVQDHARIQRDDLFGRNEERIDVDFLNPALFDHQLAEAHQQFFQGGQIDWAASTKAQGSAVNLRSLHQSPRQGAIQRRKAERAVFENLNKISAGAEQKHRPELGIDAAAENKLVTILRDHRLH